MYKRAATAALVFAFFLSLSAPPHARAAALHATARPRFCFGSVPVPCAPTVIEQATPKRDESWRNRWRVRLGVDYDFVQTNTVGGQGSGNAIDANLKITLPGGRFSNTFRYSRYNVEVPRFHFCPTCGALVLDNENDDYGEYDDDFDYWCPDDDEWGFGLSYVDYHPIYAVQAIDMSGVGFGIDRAPKYHTDYSPYGSLYYYPNISGTNNELDIRASYQIWRYDAGINYRPVLTNPLSFQLGLKGESWIGKGQAQNYRVVGGYIGSSFSW
jgi:hypothetical protein